MLSDKLPILPDIDKKLHNYATNLENFSIYDYEKSQQIWEREINPIELLHFEESPLFSNLKVQRDPFTGEIQDFHEVFIKSAGATAQNSMLLNRAPLPPNKTTRGSASFIPFLPGSFQNDTLNIPQYETLKNDELLTIPPGFSRGLTFDTDGITVLKDNQNVPQQKFPEQKNVVNLLELAQNEQNSLGNWRCLNKNTTEDKESNATKQHPDEDIVIPKENLVLNISKTPSLNIAKSTDFAILLDTTKPVKDFNKKIPNMAKKYEFQLDPFQQLAILQLEKHNHVFVAAHTSAGKTVVAEYAIALSQQHKTRTIYTSPIKALSNQKYRDFKKNFEDVGLITGDFQINDKASCLVMTTEILRSMLYCGSDITRDLEFVIFDEVHYVNDRDRGHVWEQVLILLPAHVCVVMLSATVPNPEKFADWLGRIHQKKVYVITTSKRPVPLEHFLYTGINEQTKNNRFLLLKENDWVREGYMKAKNAINEQQEKKGQLYKPINEKVLWESLIKHLKQNNLLPAVAFAFSRNKCDKNAMTLHSLSAIDFTTNDEKYRIKKFYQRCIKNLKEADRDIPQVVLMGDILSRGIGVHHSGVLPIIKEIVEMLFEERLVKLLFATETFAMGVNMPARTVIFDSITKHDGQEWRTLEPAEYIQMAGRAGRRGQDDKGTVIILCKNRLPQEPTLRTMMRDQPHSLKSQFRLTYGMVLSLLRVERLKVEDMMSRSFLEADHQKKISELKNKLIELEKKINENNEELDYYLQPLVLYFNTSISYLIYRNDFLNNLFMHPKLSKVITPGRVLLISYKNHINKLALLIDETKGGKFNVLILTDNNLNEELDDIDTKTNLWYKMLSLASDQIFCPSTDSLNHKIIEINALDIMEITRKIIKLKTDLIMKDWSNRQIPRFKNNPPGQTTFAAIQELHKLSLSLKNTNDDVNYYHFINDLHVDDNELYENLQEMYILKNEMKLNLSNTKIPNFIEQFRKVYDKKYLEKERDDLKFTLNSNPLLYEDYRNRITLLKELKYVTNNNVVALKGKVACEIGMNELLATEIVLKNFIRELKPAEVAALFSTIVFQVRKKNLEDNEGDILKQLTPDLRKAIKELEAIHSDIISKEMRLSIRSEDIQDELNFGVIKVVYDWASNMSFAEIMEHTDHQEGIIVRCIQQLNDMICDVRDAAKIIGNPELQSKMDETSKAIKRDIVFAPSLYTEDETKF